LLQTFPLCLLAESEIAITTVRIVTGIVAGVISLTMIVVAVSRRGYRGTKKCQNRTNR
jgi:hypothetical protein